jgi:hypothetical protein
MNKIRIPLLAGIGLLVLLFLSPSAVFAQMSANASCHGGNLEVSWSGAGGGGVRIAGSGPGLLSVVILSGDSGSTTFGGPGTWTGVSVEDSSSYLLLGDFSCGHPAMASGSGDDDADDDSPGPDDRINREPAAPVAVYCRGDGIHLYSIDRFGHGRLAFIATFNEINAVGIPTANTLIDSGAGIGLYRLTSGEFQVNSTRRDSEQARRMAFQQQADGPVIHVVQRGENLFRLAIRYHTTVQAIAAANGITDVNRIYVGQRLIIPGASTTQATTPGTTGANPPPPSSAGIGAGYVFIFGGC